MQHFPINLFCIKTIIFICHPFQTHVLTAAHCVYRTKARRLRIVAGEHNLRVEEGREQAWDILFRIFFYFFLSFYFFQKKKILEARSLHVHPGFEHKTLENDIAVIRLKGRLRFNR